MIPALHAERCLCEARSMQPFHVVRASCFATQEVWVWRALFFADTAACVQAQPRVQPPVGRRRALFLAFAAVGCCSVQSQVLAAAAAVASPPPPSPPPLSLASLQAQISAMMPPTCAAGQLLQYDKQKGWSCATPPLQLPAASDAGKLCRADAAGASVVCDVAPSSLAVPPDCMPPSGARLEYTTASGWTCICAPGYSGASCSVGSGLGLSPGGACAPPPPCAAPSGTTTYTRSSTGDMLCVCAVGYTGSPCALPRPPPPPSPPPHAPFGCAAANDAVDCSVLGDLYFALNMYTWNGDCILGLGMCSMDDFPSPLGLNTGSRNWASALVPGASVNVCVSFAGVSCDPATGRVVSIVLAGASLLVGTLPASLGQLTSLQLFGLCPYPSPCSFISGVIPASYANLTNLVSGLWASSIGTPSLPLCGELPAGWCLSGNQQWLGACPPGFSDRFVDGTGVFSGLGDQRTYTFPLDRFGYGSTRLPPCAGEYGPTPAPTFGSPSPGSAGCVSPSHGYLDFTADVGAASPKWTPVPVNGASAAPIIMRVGLPPWAPTMALKLSNTATFTGGDQYVDLGTPVIGGPFTLAVLALTSTPVLCNGPYSGCMAYIVSGFDGGLGNPVPGTTAWPQGFGIGISVVTARVVTNSQEQGLAYNFVDPKNDFVPAIWQHLVLVYDGLYAWRLYRNGIFRVGGTMNFIIQRRALLNRLFIGHSLPGALSDSSFNGQIADLQYYDGVAFTAKNVTDLYTGALKAGGCSA